MHAIQLAVRLTGLALASQTFFQNCVARSLPSRQLQSRAEKMATPQGHIIQDFLISDLHFKSVAVDHGPISSNYTFSFHFMDPNSNGTKTTCAQSWVGSNVTDGAPLGNEYSQCVATNNTSESFQWKFETINSLSSFQAVFTHGFNDPANYPEPYTFVQYFSETPFNLTCKSRGGNRDCSLPRGQSPMHASITSISN